jgi:hypothetical protein
MKPDTRASSLNINSLSNQSSILASHSINEITASFEANASFALSIHVQMHPIHPWLAPNRQNALG